MAGQLVARRLRAVRGASELFSELDLVVAPGDVVGVVGPNGAGTSTMLELLAGTLGADSGSVTLSPTDATVGLLGGFRSTRRWNVSDGRVTEES